MGLDPVTVMAGAALISSAAGAGASAYSAHKQNSMAKKEEKRQRELMEQQKAQALEERKRKIDAQREQLGAGGGLIGRRSLLSGSETGLLSSAQQAYGSKTNLG